MAIEKAFNIAIPNQPYVDDFSDGTEHASVYNGDRYIKFQYHAETGHIVNVIGNGDTEDEMVANEGPLMEGHLPAVLDADAAPLHAALITRQYTTGEVADYTETLSTTDAEGNDEKMVQMLNQMEIKFKERFTEATVQVDYMRLCKFRMLFKGTQRHPMRYEL